MGWGVIAELNLEHAYYAPGMPPVTVRPTDPRQFDKDGLLLRQQGARILIVAQEDNTDLPETVTLDLDAQNPDVLALSAGSDWKMVPQISLPRGVDHARLKEADASEVAQAAGKPKLAQVTFALEHGNPRQMAVTFEAVATHWAYHVVGTDAGDVFIEDTEGHVEFDPLGPFDLPDGTPSHVIRTKEALPARARPKQRFTLSRPGPFGPRVVIPVLPAPQPHFVTVPAPDGAGTLNQSDIYVSIF